MLINGRLDLRQGEGRPLPLLTFHKDEARYNFFVDGLLNKAHYFFTIFAQESLRVTIRLNTWEFEEESLLSAQK